MEIKDVESYIKIRNAIQVIYPRFRGSTELEVNQLKELSKYDLKIVGLQIHKCYKGNVKEENILTEIIKRIKALTYKPPTELERGEFYQKSQNNASKRCLSILESGLSYEEIKAVIYCVLETMRDDEILRTDRPLPTDPKFEWQKKPIQNMNDSDAEYLERIDLYKNEINIPLTDRIPLSEIQMNWLRYINCEIDQIPKQLHAEKRVGVTNVNSPGDNQIKL
jgi:basic membrane lipoprotein Med (substrate-binding protein (PBP1-ABC) superfamily)